MKKNGIFLFLGISAILLSGCNSNENNGGNSNPSSQNEVKMKETKIKEAKKKFLVEMK